MRTSMLVFFLHMMLCTYGFRSSHKVSSRQGTFLDRTQALHVQKNRISGKTFLISMSSSDSQDEDFGLTPEDLRQYITRKRGRELMQDDVREILRKMKRFYRGYKEESMTTMEQIWSESEAVKVVIPDVGFLAGHDAVMGNMRKIFAPPPPPPPSNPMLGMLGGGDEGGTITQRSLHPSDFKLRLRGSTAWVTTTEEIRGRTGGGPMGNAQTVTFPKMRVTTVLRKEAGGEWKLLMRQISQQAPVQIKDEPKEKARSERGTLVLTAGGEVLSAGAHPDDLPVGFSEQLGLGAVEMEGADVARIASDLRKRLNARVAQAEEAGQAGDVKKGSMSVVSFDGQTGKQKVRTLYRGEDAPPPPALAGAGGKGAKKKAAASSSSKRRAAAAGAKPRDGTRRTVDAIRRLCDENRISAAQKRALLADVIRAAAAGGGGGAAPSLATAAHALLLGDHADDPGAAASSSLVEEEHLREAYEEFADQCRLFADRLLAAEAQGLVAAAAAAAAAPSTAQQRPAPRR